MVTAKDLSKKIDLTEHERFKLNTLAMFEDLDAAFANDDVLAYAQALITHGCAE
jgi:hypothetical protein